MKKAIDIIMGSAWSEQMRVAGAFTAAACAAHNVDQLRHRVDEITRDLCVDFSDDVWAAAVAMWETAARGGDPLTATVED